MLKDSIGDKLCGWNFTLTLNTIARTVFLISRYLARNTITTMCYLRKLYISLAMHIYIEVSVWLDVQPYY